MFKCNWGLTVYYLDNFGRQCYFCRLCGFFQWADTSADAVRVQPNPYSKNSSVPVHSSNSSVPVHSSSTFSSGPTLRLLIHIAQIEPRPLKVWFSVTGPRDRSLDDFYTSIPREQKKFSQSTRTWMFDMVIYDNFLSELRIRILNVDIVSLPRSLSGGLKTLLNAPLPEISEPDILPILRQTILPFQLEAVRFVIARGGRALIADEMGCGTRHLFWRIKCISHLKFR